MKEIRLTCPKCSQSSLYATEGMAGNKTTCPNCGNAVVVTNREHQVPETESQQSNLCTHYGKKWGKSMLIIGAILTFLNVAAHGGDDPGDEIIKNVFVFAIFSGMAYVAGCIYGLFARK